MEWHRAYSLKSYLRSTMWVVPVAAYVISFFLIRIVGWLDDWLQWSWSWKLNVATVDTTLESIVSATVAFIVFAFSSLLVAIQIASAQLTPRIIATTLLRDNTIRMIIALFVLTLAFSVGTLARAQDTVPYLLLTVAVVARRRLDRGLHLSDRLRRAPVAAGQHRVAAGRRRGSR